MHHIPLLLCGLFLLVSMNVSAVEPRTAHTFKLGPHETPPTATIEDVSWLAGDWVGTAFGAEFEEVWNPPSAGSMVGLFKLMEGDQVKFYELMILSETQGRLSLKVKHFSADFIAWEDKEDYVDFKLVAIDQNAVHFSGLSFYRVSADVINAYIVMKHDGETREEPLIYQRRVASD